MFIPAYSAIVDWPVLGGAVADATAIPLLKSWRTQSALARQATIVG